MSDVICSVDGTGKEGAASPGEPPTDNGQTADWQAYNDDEYGFQIQYPSDWALQEAAIEMSDGTIPIKRVLQFGPPEWSGQMAPVSVEVGVGNLEEIQMWPVSAMDEVNATDINGYKVLAGEGMYGELFYIFEHPTNARLRVAARDNLSGSGEGAFADIVKKL